ncbi:MAG TPA: energy transducer TonB [Candidatus Elarobacter sp.]|jgi:outer membrane biosynthesis protein TonB|nr:energy transducer TonB [Candidatus Elarobacter sp.]
MTTPKRLLVYAFALSIALHVIALQLVRPMPNASAEEPVPSIPVTRLPTPPPTPRPTPTPHATPQPTSTPRSRPPAPRRILVTLPHAVAHNGGPSRPADADLGLPAGPEGPDTGPSAGPASDATPAAVAASTPTPQPTPTPLACARPDVPAATLRTAEPDTPAIAQQQGIFGTVQVVVSLDARSRLVAVHVQSSPSAMLNAPALAAARASTYRTEIRDCVPIAADYLFSVEFAAE